MKKIITILISLLVINMAFALTSLDESGCAEIKPLCLEQNLDSACNTYKEFCVDWKATSDGDIYFEDGDVSLLGRLVVGDTSDFNQKITAHGDIEGIGNLNILGNLVVGDKVDFNQKVTAHDEVIILNGNVGIGRSDPAENLHVQVSQGNKAAIRIESVGINPIDFVTNPDNSGGLWHYGDPLIFGTRNTERMRLDGDGHVGIGTPTTPARLSLVSGTTAADGIAFGEDVNLYRAFDNGLATDDTFVTTNGKALIVKAVGQDATGQHGVYIGQTPGTYMGIGFGGGIGPLDTYLYREDSGLLKTPGNLNVGGDIESTGNIFAHGDFIMSDVRMNDGGDKIDFHSPVQFNEITHLKGDTYISGDNVIIGSDLVTIGSSDNNGIEFLTGDTNKPAIFVKRGGNVGIGTSNPKATLHIRDVNTVVGLEDGTDIWLDTESINPSGRTKIQFKEGGFTSLALEYDGSLKNANNKLHISDAVAKEDRVTFTRGGKVAINTAGANLIMKSPNGDCWACGPTNKGQWNCSVAACI